MCTSGTLGIFSVIQYVKIKYYVSVAVAQYVCTCVLQGLWARSVRPACQPSMCSMHRTNSSVECQSPHKVRPRLYNVKLATEKVCLFLQ